MMQVHSHRPKMTFKNAYCRIDKAYCAACMACVGTPTPDIEFVAFLLLG